MWGRFFVVALQGAEKAAQDVDFFALKVDAAKQAADAGEELAGVLRVEKAACGHGVK